MASQASTSLADLANLLPSSLLDRWRLRGLPGAACSSTLASLSGFPGCSDCLLKLFLGPSDSNIPCLSTALIANTDDEEGLAFRSENPLSEESKREPMATTWNSRIQRDVLDPVDYVRSWGCYLLAFELCLKPRFERRRWPDDTATVAVAAIDPTWEELQPFQGSRFPCRKPRLRPKE